MAGLSGFCVVDDCREDAKALVVTDLEILDDDEKVEDVDTQLLPMCKTHAIEELSDGTG